MQLSIIIVNYNVKFFLEQCLLSVQKAIKEVEAEVFVVDNNSVDGSCKMVQERFPWVNLIENKKNLGFSKANNQAIRLSSGQYILLLNPDTLVEEDTFEKCIKYMDANQLAGGLGVKMIDGKGKFLPESKRGLPTPWVSFSKIFGLSKLFPKSRFFNTYHLGYLSKNEINEIEVLPGAFMFIRKTVLDEIGLLDENFFMYGEDIDLSYRILKAGYKNIFYPRTTIIHYKGESTKKGSINYVLVFYNAMIIFARKHFSTKNARIFSFLINIAVYFRATLSLVKRFFYALAMPVIDALLIFTGFIFIKPHWESYKFQGAGAYPSIFLQFVVPAYILIWIFSIYVSGGYQRPIKLKKVSRGIIVGTLVILTIYALLPETLRFSRALILIGTIWTLGLTLLIRNILAALKIPLFRIDYPQRFKRVIIVGKKDEADRVFGILKQSHITPDLIGYVNPQDQNGNEDYIGTFSQLNEIIMINKIDEIIFCSKNLPAGLIIQSMSLLSDVNIEYKIASPDSISVIGSSSIDSPGEFYTLYFNSVSKKSNRRKKRVFDIIVSCILILVSPFIFFFYRNKPQFFKNLIHTLKGILSFVGYSVHSGDDSDELPAIKPGILTPADYYPNFNLTSESRNKLDIAYAKDYKIEKDFFLVMKSWNLLDKMPDKKRNKNI